jgi:hypothetical protein
MLYCVVVAKRMAKILGLGSIEVCARKDSNLPIYQFTPSTDHIAVVTKCSSCQEFKRFWIPVTLFN